MAVQVEAPAAPASGNGTPVAPSAMQRVVDEFLGEGPAAASAAPAEQPVEEPAAAEPVKAAEASEAEEARREFQRYAQAQEQWSRERERLSTQAKGAADQARREVLAALESDDPDGALERLGLAADTRKLLARRLVLRHVPADKASGELKTQIENENLRAELRSMKSEFKKELEEIKAERTRERQEATQKQQAEQALSTLHSAFQNAGDDLKFVRARYGKRRDMAVRDALDVGRDLAKEGKITTRMSEPEIARKIVSELNTRYREEFGLADGSSPPVAAAPATPNPATSPRPVTPPKNAAEVSAARTISRGATEVTRPPPSQEEPLDEEAWLEEEGRRMAKMRREGKFSPTAE